MHFFEPHLEPDERDFLAEVRAFLDRELDDGTIAAEDAQRSMVADHVRGNAWIDKLRPRLWHVGHWPREHGGAGLTPEQNFLLLYEMGYRGAPHLVPMALNYVGPLLMAFGTPEQRAAMLPPIVDGTDHWCQGFSEPGAGSDLASVATFAERRGDAYVVNGSKIWTTDAHHANRIFALVRTHREATRDAMSFLLMDMDQPGVTVRPIRMMSGDHEFNQVFFDDVEVPVEKLLGGEGDGWKIAKYLLDIERGQFVFGGRLRRRLERLRETLEAGGALAGGTRDALDALDLDLAAYELTELRLSHVAGATNELAEASVVKIEWTELLQRLDELWLECAGVDALAPLAEGEGGHRGGLGIPGWLASYFNNRAATIYGGSNEVQRNLVCRALRRASG